MNTTMQDFLTHRVAPLLAGAIGLCLLSPVATAAGKAGLDVFQGRAAATPAQLPAYAKAQSGVRGTLNPGAMSAPVLELALADGTTIEARLQRVARDDQKGTQSWIGTFDDAPGSSLILSRAKGAVTGVALYKDEVLQIAPVAGGSHVLYAIDESKLPVTKEVMRAPKLAADSLSGSVSGSTTTTAEATTAATGVTQDLLVVYTAATAARYGAANIESQIQTAVQAANQAFLNSSVGITLNLVGLKQTTLVEQAGMNATIDVLQVDPGVASLRDSVGADMVMLVGENGDYCGLANLMKTNSTSFAPYAFGAVYSSCLGVQALAHEIGHQQGLTHDRETSASWVGVFPYSYGYRICATGGFADIMAYTCTGASRVLQHSNPSVTYNGYPTGIAYATSPSTAAEAARSLNETAATVAAFRASKTGVTPAAPAAPSGLAARSVLYNSVTLGWTDNATDETGYKVERSGDGVNFTEIATLGAGSNGYVDGSVAAKANYWYRVRAYNSIGPSAWSATIGLTTPDVPPPAPSAPTGVASLNGADGTAAVSWLAATGTVASYEVRRETYNSRKGTWGSATTVATVPASVRSIVDAAGAGTYRYYVRSTNAGGVSAYAGPSQVTVTNTAAKRGRR